ncbi:unnamed protein product [Parascedosporium putredinis]|uniref:Integral membrane protein n=1 Tax=Parascedosporium putredinis TaxID=1442378 RepID=A0A9P1GYP9_9PEZI|nr:unnamed protein product [Parascedosporium putredinis]CAI7991971.1 unnamed protein product [Parascedosporium putredinis]
MLVLWGVIEFNVGNMVSSLPFLAPVFLRKAREYRTKQSRGYGSSNGQSGRRIGKGSQLTTGKGGDSGLRSKKGTTAYATAGFDKHSTSGSEEDILRKTDGNQHPSARDHDLPIQHHEPNAIIKSVSYSVRVDDDTASGSGPRYM